MIERAAAGGNSRPINYRKINAQNCDPFASGCMYKTAIPWYFIKYSLTPKCEQMNYTITLDDIYAATGFAYRRANTLLTKSSTPFIRLFGDKGGRGRKHHCLADILVALQQSKHFTPIMQAALIQADQTNRKIEQ